MKRTEAVQKFGPLLKDALSEHQKDLKDGRVEHDDSMTSLANRLIRVLESNRIMFCPVWKKDGKYQGGWEEE